MSTPWIALIVVVIVAVGIMVFVGGGDPNCGTRTTKACGTGDQRPYVPPYPR